MSDHLERARYAAAWDATQEPGTSHRPDELTVPALIAGILDAIIAVAERLPALPTPGVCWHDSGVTWPGESHPVRCELRAGHAGAHEAIRPNGGTATWLDTETTS